MNKGAEVPKPLMIGILVVVVLVVGFFGFRKISPPPATVDTTQISPERLEDPDRGPSTQQGSGN